MKKVIIFISLIISFIEILNAQAPDPDTRQLDKNLTVGSTAGSLNVTPSGGAVYSIPISCPPGIGKMLPHLSVGYSTQSGNGIMGWGWNISGISMISRVPQNNYNEGHPKGITFTKDDRFLLDGVRLFVFNGENYGSDGVRYYAEKESFSKIISHGSGVNGPDYFDVTTKDGTLLKFGSNTGRLNNTGLNAVVAWYLDYVEDVHGNYMNFEYENVGLYLVLKKVTYGANKSGSGFISNTIEFNYQDRSDLVPVHYGNQKAYLNRLLQQVQVKTNNQLYRQYDFEYVVDTYSRLVKVTESNDKGEKYNPTIFKYGPNNTIIQVDSPTVSPNSLGVSVKDQNWSSADVNGDGYTDLISMYKHEDRIDPNTTQLNTYVQTYINNGSNSFTEGPRTSIKYTGQIGNFYVQPGILSADVDGDYKNEIIIPIYDSGGGTINFVIIKDGTIISESGPNIIRGARDNPLYTMTDYNNDGFSDFVYLEKNPYNGSYVCKIGECTGNYSSYYGLFLPHEYNFSGINKPNHIFSVDFDADGLNDLVITGENNIYIFKNTDGYFPSTPTKTIVTNIDNFSFISPGDFDGDGLVDFIYNASTRSQWYLALNDGNLGLSQTLLSNVTAKNEYHDDQSWDPDDNIDYTMVADFNNDGKTDLIVWDGSFDYNCSTCYSCIPWKTTCNPSFKEYTVKWYTSNGTGFSLYKNVPYSDIFFNNLYVSGDFNGDGRWDLMNYAYDCFNGNDKSEKWRSYTAPNKNNESRLLTAISNGLNIKSNITYSSLVCGTNYTKSGSPEAGLSFFNAPLTLIKDITTTNGVSNPVKISYSYKNALFQRYLGFMGFSEMSSYNNLTKEKSVNYSNYKFSAYNLNDDFFIPRVVKTVRSINGRITNSTDFQYSMYRYFTPTSSQEAVHRNRPYFFYQYASIATDSIEKNIVTVSSDYDNEGNVTRNSTVITKLDNTVVDSKTTLFKNFDDRILTDDNQTKNAPSEITTEQSHINAPGANFFQKTTFLYNSDGTVRQKTENADKANKLISFYTYDAYGNILSDTVNSTRYTRIEYDATHRFPKKQYNSLNQKREEREYDIFGNVNWSTDINSLKTTSNYDSWGNLKEIISPENIHYKDGTFWASGGDSPAGALYFAADTSHVNRFEGAEYFDPNGRTLRKVSTGYNGIKLFVDYKYNTLGQLIEATDPYQAGSTSIKKTTYYYDSFLQLQNEVLPTGVTKTYTYQPLTDKNEKNIKTSLSTGEVYSKYYDASGLLIKSIDPGGTISNKYNHSEQLISTVTPGTKIRINYNEYGLQDSLIDANSGTVTYGYNSFGELIYQKDSKGKITTMDYDNLGRVIVKTVDGISTKYTYDPSNAIGEIDSITCQGKAGLKYEYNGGLGRLSRMVKRDNTKSFEYKYIYDSEGKLSEFQYPSGVEIELSVQ